MLIRISLIVAILAGLGVAGIAFFPLQDQIKQTEAQRQEFHDNWRKELAAHTKFENLYTATSKQLETTKTELASAQQERDAAKSAEAEAEKKSDELASNLKKTQADLEASKDRVAAWESLGIPIAKARDILNSLKQVKEDEAALEEEKAIIYAKSRKLQAKIADLTGTSGDVDMPEGLFGKVMAVDPRYDFVVLNLGDKQGVLPRGKFYVSRNSKLVAQIQVTDNVNATTCIANVMPGWHLGDIMEGDTVSN